MIPGCTNDLVFEIEDVDLSQASNIYVSLKQGIHNIVKTDPTVTVETENNKTTSVVTVGLTQDESLRLQSGEEAKAQINWLYVDAHGDTKRAATDTENINIGEQLLPRTLP